MKKAFEENVSRTKPRLRMGAALAEAAEAALAQAGVDAVASAAENGQAELEDLSDPLSDGVPGVQGELDGLEAAPVSLATRDSEERTQVTAAPTVAAPFAHAAATASPQPRTASAPAASASVARSLRPVALAESRPAAAPRPRAVNPPAEPTPEVRRERLKERLKSVRENPRPEPLPPTVAEAGVVAVERIARLQTELGQVKALNLALSQDLDSARRQAERATEEARSRMDEARRLASEMEERAKLLGELEGELATLESERDESLLSLQETRHGLDLADKEKDLLKEEIGKREKALADSLSEEERLATELEGAKDESGAVRRALDALTAERDTLARQVADLTRERTELMEARKALESVHRALSKAVGR